MGGRGGEIGSSATQPEAVPLKFEYDPAKSASNKAKHGIDFEETKAIWQDEQRTVVAVRIVGVEQRDLTVGMLNGKLHTAVTTMRGDIIRIISVRRARPNEEAVYGR
jgi:uncharacterized DUF497 family protein